MNPVGSGARSLGMGSEDVKEHTFYSSLIVHF